MEYLAKWNGGCVFLSRDTQMDEFLSKGASIYSVENDAETLIATPEDGFLAERPVFPVPEEATFSAESDYAIAGKILLGLED